MKIGSLVSFFLLFLSLNSHAFSKEISSFELANSLGSLLASEEYCGLSFDQDAISSFIDNNVDAKDLEFPSSLRAMTRVARDDLNSLNESEKTAHCRQITRLALSFEFLKENK